jgi:predicted ATPase
MENKEGPMKFTFANLGTIKKTTLDLRPLTLLIGPNNSSKTYMAYSIYGVFKYLKKAFLELTLPQEVLVIAEETATLNLNLLPNIIENHLSQVLKKFNENLSAFFQDSTGKLFTKTLVELDFTSLNTAQWVKKSISEYQSPNRGYAVGYKNILLDTTVKLDSHGNHLAITIAPLESSSIWKLTPEPDKRRILSQHFLYSLLTVCQDENINLTPAPFLLPTERHHLVDIYPVIVSTRSRTKELFEPRQTINFYPEPIEDFLEFLTILELMVKNQQKFIPKKGTKKDRLSLSLHSPSDLNFLSELIESHVQTKNKTVLMVENNAVALKIRTTAKHQIDFHNASSSIKQLAGLILYLRYRARPGDLLIIDEPEMNLHPEGQAKLLEILAILVNHGVQVLLTTHSPYLIAHANNLILGSEDPSKKEQQAKLLYLQDSQSFLAADQVAAYEMRNNKVVSLKNRQGNISWGKLSDTSTDIQQKFYEILDAGE